MLTNNYFFETKINEMTGNGNNVDLTLISQDEQMQILLDNLVIEVLNKAGAKL